MSISDPLADLFTRIRNAQRAGLLEIIYRPSKLNKQILKLLFREGYIEGYFELAEYNVPLFSEKNVLVCIKLKYEEGLPCIKKIERISTPGCRVYTKLYNLEKPYHGLGTYILSTSKGILSDQEAKNLKVGGELLGKIL
jgi:small subunit ribosomal protein S8